MFTKVLVLADGDDPNQPALRRALQCVDDSGDIELLAVVYEPALEGYLGNKAMYEPLRKRVLDERRERAAGLARAAEGWGVRATAQAVWSSSVERAVADRVAARGIDLVVAAPTELARGGVRGGGLTHSAWQLVLHCPAPVLVVKSDGQTKYRGIVAAVDPFHAHAKPAELDKEILRNAKALQAAAGGALTVLHCHVPFEYFGADLSGQPTEPPQPAERRTAVEALCRATGIAGTAARVVAGVPHAAIQKLEASGEADAIVMGGLARGRFAELVFGSTAERVLHQTHADVLVVKPAPPVR
jgi:universal stress protein E